MYTVSYLTASSTEALIMSSLVGPDTFLNLIFYSIKTLIIYQTNENLTTEQIFQSEWLLKDHKLYNTHCSVLHIG